ncbi:MAG TPA: glycoside hydrolase family 76 protein [Solirubrobacteraceae bacterium]|nr:glycoside hydrolase family 76 protein [Solirubrobacteraceae bacterium]
MSPSTVVSDAASRRPSRSWAALAAFLVALLVSLGGSSAASAASAASGDTVNPVDAERAVATYRAMQANLYVPRYELYVKSDPTQNFGYLWDFVNPFAATDEMAAIPGIGAGYHAAMQARDRGVMRYYDTQEVSPTGQPQPPAFASGVRPPLGSEQPTYYDDNAWVGLDFLREYRITHQRSDLTRAEGIFHFVVSGWDTRTNVACPGGVFWEDVANSPRNTISNAPNAEVGIEIYRATHDPYYLAWAKRMYDWVRRCLMNTSDMYGDHIDDSGSVDTTLWSYNQGTMIGAGVLLYRATHDRAYLRQAERTAAASLRYYGADGNLYHQPDVFDVIFFRNLFALARINHDRAYARMAAAYADTAWLQDRQPTGLFTDPDPSGGESLENQTAPMVELYALLAQKPPVFAATGSTSPASVVVQPGASGSTTLTLQSVTGSAQTVTWTASTPAGITVTPPSGRLTVPGGGSAGTPVSIAGGSSDGDYQVTFHFSSPAGQIRPVSTSVIVARPGDLAPFFDDTGISDDSDQAAGNLDGLGFSYSEQALSDAGLTPGAALTSGGVQYDWPDVAAGRPDNVTAAGQTIAVPPVTGATELGVLGSATNGPSSGTMTITYTDGTSQTATLGLTDWTAGSPAYGNGIAASMPYRNSASGTSQQIGTKVFTATFPLQSGKTVASVTLPTRADQGLIHVFALGTDAGPLTTAGG